MVNRKLRPVHLGDIFKHLPLTFVRGRLIGTDLLPVVLTAYPEASCSVVSASKEMCLFQDSNMEKSKR